MNDKENDYSSLLGLFGSLKTVFDKAYTELEPMVNAVLDNQITSENDIERIMDVLLDYGEDSRFVELYRRLCRFVYPRFPILVKEHIAIFLEQHEEAKEGMNRMEEEFARSSVPEVTIIEAGEKARKEYGHKWGSQCLPLSADQIHALTEGKQLAIDIMEGEYVLFIRAEENTIDG